MKTKARVFERCPNCGKKTFRANHRPRAGVGQVWRHEDGSCRDRDCRYSGWRHVIDNRKETLWWTRGKPSCKMCGVASPPTPTRKSKGIWSITCALRGCVVRPLALIVYVSPGRAADPWGTAHGDGLPTLWWDTSGRVWVLL